MTLPLVSITIPTYNSANTLEMCMKSIVRQTYPNIEVLVVDSNSSDRTREIALEYGARIIPCNGFLLAARYIGAMESRGEYVVLLDSDQTLREDTVERAVAMMDDYDMLILEEHSLNSQLLIPRLYKASKILISKAYRSGNYSFNPLEGGNPPRFFRRELLVRALANIPSELINKIHHYDHDIIYYECYRLSDRVGILYDAVYSIEPTFKKLYKTNIRYGQSLHQVKKTHYWNLFLKKRFVGIRVGKPYREGILAFILMLILLGVQAIGYLRGYFKDMGEERKD